MSRRLRALCRILFIFAISTVLNLVLLCLPGLASARNAVASFFFKILIKGCGIEVQSQLPLTNLPSRKRLLIVANHVSYLDILIICALHPCIFLAKFEVSQWPVFGWVARNLGCVFVHRDSLMGRATALRRCLATCSSSSIAIFPEGTTTSNSVPHRNSWTRGHAWIARRAQVDSILCLGLAFENQHERAWTDDMSLLPHLFKTLGERKIRVKVSGTWIAVDPHHHTRSLAEATLNGVCLAVNHGYPG